MLLGLLGIAIPVILHLLNRRQAKVIEWGAMRFLLDSLVSRRRRVLLEEILLLATRCLIVALAALALARPFVLDSSRVPWLVVLPAGLLAVVLFAMNFALWRYPVWRWRVILAALVLALAAAASTWVRTCVTARFRSTTPAPSAIRRRCSSTTAASAGCHLSGAAAICTKVSEATP